MGGGEYNPLPWARLGTAEVSTQALSAAGAAGTTPSALMASSSGMALPKRWAREVRYVR